MKARWAEENGMKRFLIFAILPLAASSNRTWAKQKQRNDAVCSISQVYVVPSELPHGGQFDYFAIESALEDYTWLSVADVVVLMPKNPPVGTGTVQLTEFGSMGYKSQSHSSGDVAWGESGKHVAYELKLMDANGNVLWTGVDSRELEGVKSSASEYGAEAHEVHAKADDAMQRLAWRLNREAHCGNRPKYKKLSQ
jgi:hypothetical protein